MRSLNMLLRERSTQQGQEIDPKMFQKWVTSPVSSAQLTLDNGSSRTNSWGGHCMWFTWVTKVCASAGGLSTIPKTMETCSGITKWGLQGKQRPPFLEKLGRGLESQPTRPSWHHQTSAVASIPGAWIRRWGAKLHKYLWDMKNQLAFLASCQDGKQMWSLYCGFFLPWQADVVTSSRAGWRNVPSSPRADQSSLPGEGRLRDTDLFLAQLTACKEGAKECVWGHWHPLHHCFGSVGKDLQRESGVLVGSRWSYL